mgnify:CR=1 FL=1
MRLLPKPVSKIVRGKAIFNDQDIFKLQVGDLHGIRGKKIAMIFQEPMTALNPVHGIGKQIIENVVLEAQDYVDRVPDLFYFFYAKGRRFAIGSKLF